MCWRCDFVWHSRPRLCLSQARKHLTEHSSAFGGTQPRAAVPHKITAPAHLPNSSSFSCAPSIPLSLSPSVPFSLCPFVPLSLCPSVPSSLCPFVPRSL